MKTRIAAYICALLLLLPSSSWAARPYTNRGHAYVDLGLSVCWASCNLGASSPEQPGDYYAWGETAVKDSCTVWNYRWCEGFYWDGRYTGYSAVDGRLVLDAADDAAHAAWGGRWRIPTHGEQEELRTRCAWTWKENYRGSGVNGYLVESRVAGFEGRSIFLPAGGDKLGTVVRSYGVRGFYMSSVMVEGQDHGACSILFENGSVDWMYCYRYYGQSVRPVLEK